MELFNYHTIRYCLIPWIMDTVTALTVGYLTYGIVYWAYCSCICYINTIVQELIKSDARAKSFL